MNERQLDEWNRKWTVCLYAGSHGCQCSHPQWLVECEPSVWDMTTSEPVELVALACGCAGEELRTAVEISRQQTSQVWEAVVWMNHDMAAADPPERARPIRNPCLPHKRLVMLIKTGSSPPNNPAVKHTTPPSGGPLPSTYWWRDSDADMSELA